MFEKARPVSDAFTFSLGGMATISSFAFAPAITGDRLNKALDERFGLAPEDRPSTAREIEDFLARWFAPGCCRTA